ncbi:2-amino-4-hydroxy-6-hydroxymethyldihydropteridine diphosphokinase [Breznakiella homolactica]|uniref:2-amino-4-hydroxy-6-hydroxymethyldihydropteridine pyrophosphokinase n=1 Tax=Breznakiella homolactica TaxID=2798577 RepID=A0A7T7XKX9_9SPIR|nr:2-amino-4-hydroxy-6-hydroxymethyldihydropteridine diphosphokinase [Breznakiella homolactica]QQO08168.1 2-amino-4-hydroxy-6-hydroxymethyldihydropteridine diphosphokinase [Breznakiella homolactica]
MDSDSPLAVLSLGANLGDRKKNLEGALSALSGGLSEFRVSSLYETDPQYITDQGKFLNAAAAGFFAGAPEELLGFIQDIESRFGRDRRRERRWGERPLDIDIILLGDTIVSRPPLLEIPHPRMHERAFVLVPVLELFPDIKDPRSGTFLRDYYNKLSPQGIYYAGTCRYN